MLGASSDAIGPYSTEVGALTKGVNPSGPALDGEWEYFALNPLVQQARVYQEGQPGVFELVIMVCPPQIWIHV